MARTAGLNGTGATTQAALSRGVRGSAQRLTRRMAGSFCQAGLRLAPAAGLTSRSALSPCEPLALVTLHTLPMSLACSVFSHQAVQEATAKLHANTVSTA